MLAIPTAFHRLARRRDLLWQFTVRAIEMKHRGSYLGMLWAVLNPLLMLGLYVFVFSTIFGGRFNALPDETKMDYALGLFLGLVFFNVLSETLGVAPTLVVSNTNLVKKVVFPLEILPLAQLGASWFNFLINGVLLLAGIATLGRGFTLHGLMCLPVIILPHLLLTIGLGWLLAALGVFFRDIQHVVQFVAQIILYASAIFYSPQLIQKAPWPWAWEILKWNPLLHTVDLARDALLWQHPIDRHHLLFTYLAGGAAFVLGGWCFKKLQPAFADVI